MVSDENQPTKTSTTDGAAVCSEKDNLHDDTIQCVPNTMDQSANSLFVKLSTTDGTFCGILLVFFVYIFFVSI